MLFSFQVQLASAVFGSYHFVLALALFVRHPIIRSHDKYPERGILGIYGQMTFMNMLSLCILLVVRNFAPLTPPL
jgi:hypothetical protein